MGNKKKRANTDPTLSMIRDTFQENLQLANEIQRKSKSDIVTRFDLTEKFYARRIKAVAHLMPEMLQALGMFSDDFMSDRNFDGAEIRKAAEAIRSKAEDIARGKVEYATYEEVFGE